jgi:hypothetical protein
MEIFIIFWVAIGWVSAATFSYLDYRRGLTIGPGDIFIGFLLIGTIFGPMVLIRLLWDVWSYYDTPFHKDGAIWKKKD